MPELARHLQHEFVRLAPQGWEAVPEARVIEPALERHLGYAPRADVLLRCLDGSRRIWVEFEVSRADPAANQAKFATVHRLQPFPRTDALVSLLSSHISVGRRNLAANMTQVLRDLGLNAFQSVLLPGLSPAEILQWNHTPLGQITVPAAPVLTRVLELVEPVLANADTRIQFAGEVHDVMTNAVNWNHDIQLPNVAEAWGRRTVQYFVYHPATEQFAPSKFCAYVPIGADRARYSCARLDWYCRIDQETPCFDGNRAWQYLIKNLGMYRIDVADDNQLCAAFVRWQQHVDSYVGVHPKGAVLLLPPAWYAG